ncbi:HlyD family efflux transporter periplasmic adaptor subunit [Sphingobacterium sp. DK4209]|uniref:HlyD family efflux transporter periplasmic adaptor subunit n=1 Tax=Sphingobacterium zhuxiongii TaxID=2662364 RepID=A0A5Q0Q8L2_9SPHI|nr:MULTISPECIES: HlyD family efflux transporter periplasmic adaptor subunit [unclassified Sphingobacterium]MVZ66679.1 HlyD family efflux transporter periplasmic adaptor subunit [Sphingobacterium sp. DK4209]QGA25449.1 HlyD family efflux transporter periplasmic adaptor subunit [Sphingobacterium sp. dk4302]
MDRPIKQKTWNTKRILTVGGVIALVGLIGASYYYTSGNSKLNVEAERISIFEVKEDTFQEFIPINGTVLPISSIYLDASVGGRVEEKYVEDGAHLRKGDPIMRLSNTDLELSLINQETQVLNLLTQAQIAQTSAQQATINNRNQMADVEQALKESERVYNLNKKLLSEKAIGSQEYQKSLNEFNYQKERVGLTNQIVKQDEVSNAQKLSQDRETYKRTQSALQLMRQKVGDLILRAPVDGQLTSFDAEIGQNKTAGERLGQIDVLTGFKVRAEIDEHYINRIFPDLKGQFSIDDKPYEIRIKKVYTQVKDGRFLVDMEFIGARPESIRRGQTLPIRLALSDKTKAVLLAKGGFNQLTGGNWIFKLDKAGNTAYRTDIQLGRQNPEYYEVLGGLKPGDKVVISSYETYDKIQELKIKQ